MTNPELERHIATRNMIIDLLDDEHGINDRGFTALYALGVASGNKDVVDKAEFQDRRWFLGEDDAAELRLTKPVFAS